MPDAGVSPGAGEMGPDGGGGGACPDARPIYGGDFPETPEKNVFTKNQVVHFLILYLILSMMIYPFQPLYTVSNIGNVILITRLD